MSTGNRCSCKGLSHDPETCATIAEFKRREADGSAGASAHRQLTMVWLRGASVQPMPPNTPRLSASYPARETKLEAIVASAMRLGIPPHSKCSCDACRLWRLNVANLAVKDQS